MSEDRLQKILARAGLGSRRTVEEWIRQGKVTVNGQVATLGDKADPSRDAVKVDGRRVQLEAAKPLYLLLHKPSGVMSTVSDPEGRETLLDLVPPALHKGLVPVGRLDFHTSGLILLTTDGEFAHRVAHPRFGCTKTYEVKVKGRPDEGDLARLRAGILIEGRKTAPAEIEERPLPKGLGSADTSWWTVRLTEGRTRQIREMFLRVGHPVQKLRRVAIGTVRDEHLPQGQYRELTDDEVAALLDAGREEKRRQAAIEKRRAKSEAAKHGRGAGKRGGPAGGRGAKKNEPAGGRSERARGRGGKSAGKGTGGGRKKTPAGRPDELGGRGGRSAGKGTGGGRKTTPGGRSGGAAEGRPSRGPRRSGGPKSGGGGKPGAKR